MMTSRFSIGICAAAVWIVFLSATPSTALFGRPAGKAVQEAIEFTAKKFGIGIGKEGAQFSKKAGEFIAAHGDDGIRALKGVGPDILELTARHGKDLVRMCAGSSADAARYLARNVDEALPVFRQFGREGADLMLKHPGMAKPLLDQFGKKGLAVGQKLSSESLGKFLSLSAKAATRKEKDTLLDKVLKEGEKVIEFLWRHKVKLGAAIGIYSLLDEYDKAEETIETGPDGKAVHKTSYLPSVFRELTLGTVEKLFERYPWVLLVLALPLFVVIKKLLSLFCRIITMLRELLETLYARIKGMPGWKHPDLAPGRRPEPKGRASLNGQEGLDV